MKWISFIVLFVVFIVMVWIAVTQTCSKKSCPSNKCKTCPENIRILTRQCARWLTAASQDNNILIALLHGQYGMGYLYAIADIATPQEFNQSTGLDWEMLESEALKIQDKLHLRVSKAFPEAVKDLPRYLASIGGESV